MYAFTDSLREAWSDLLYQLNRHLPCECGQQYAISFDDTPNDYHADNFFLGHTCGYPYITSLYKTHDVVCVPEFNTEGVSGINYSSWFVSNKKSNFNDLTGYHGSVVAINNPDSNSGMNVLREAIAPISNGSTFFSKVIVSHSHLYSLQLVEQGEADLAAIDVVSYHFALRENLFDSSKVHIVGRSACTAGLPFVVKKSLTLDPGVICQALNMCLDSMQPENRKLLGIKQFSPVMHSDYLYTAELEANAIQQGYPVLQ